MSVIDVQMSEEFRKPKHLHVRKQGADAYDVFIGLHKVGVVSLGQDKGVTYTWKSQREDMPASFTVRRMTEMKQELTRRISRDLYMSILDSREGLTMPIKDDTDE